MRVEATRGLIGRMLPVVAVGAVLGLAACTGDDDPTIGSDGSDADPAAVETGGDAPAPGETEPPGTTLVITGAPDQSTTPGQDDGSGDGAGDPSSSDGDQPAAGAGSDGGGGAGGGQDDGDGSGDPASGGEDSTSGGSNSPDVSVQP